jgi:hypothetical protein
VNSTLVLEHLAGNSHARKINRIWEEIGAKGKHQFLLTKAQLKQVPRHNLLANMATFLPACKRLAVLEKQKRKKVAVPVTSEKAGQATPVPEKQTSTETVKIEGQGIKEVRIASRTISLLRSLLFLHACLFSSSSIFLNL